MLRAVFLAFTAVGLSYGQIYPLSETPSTGTFGSAVPIEFSMTGLDFVDYWGNSGDYLVLGIYPNGLAFQPQPNVCLIEFQNQTNVVFLQKDDGTTWKQQSIGSPTPLTNSQCTVYLAGATVSRDPANTPQQLTVTMQVAFASTYTGIKDLWVESWYGTPQGGYSGRWVDWGQITIAPVSVTVSHPTGPVYPSFSQQFTAAVAWTTNQAVTWTTSPAVGTISGSGLYTAPAVVAVQQQVNVIATSAADPTKSASGTITLLPTVAWYNSAWQYRKPIALDHTKVNTVTQTNTPLANFPTLISLTDPDLINTAGGGKVATARGNDVIFTASDGITPLNYEIETYSSSTGQLTAWVNVPSLSSTSDTIIYQYFGNANAPPTVSGSATWDQHFMGVWHLSTFW
jgi:Domain of unknown function (DUF2341)